MRALSMPPGSRAAGIAALLNLTFYSLFSAVYAQGLSADAASLLREIRKEVLAIGGYPGEDFVRGEFFLGEGDDDTNKTHAVGIVVKDEEGGASRLTIVVSRLEPARDDPRIKFTRDSRTIVCAIAAAGVELVRSDYSAAELERSLPLILRAVIDKKNLLRR